MDAAHLSPEQQSELLARARAAAAKALRIPFREISFPEPSGRLLEPGMSFVTWKEGGRLRGCIGSVEPVRPLFADVEANAVHALLRDPRFPPAKGREFPDLHLEISVLTPFLRVSDPLSGVTIGTHGVLVEKGSRRGLLLPQVASEWDWDVPTFLSHTCLKAGLPEDAWRGQDSALALHTFRAEVFGEPS